MTSTEPRWPGPDPGPATAAAPQARATDPDKRAPGRPRSARAEQAIVGAVLGMLADGVALETISVEAIAARAGVGKATIYRRWTSKEDLVVDALASLKMPLPPLAGESVRDDLIALLRVVGREADAPRTGVMMCVLPHVQRNPELYGWYQKAVEPRRECMREVLRRGIETGELRVDLDVETSIGMLAAPVILQRMAMWNPRLDVPDLAERVVDTFLAGAAVPAHRA
jgi:AcrR family transcriptional regulator